MLGREEPPDADPHVRWCERGPQQCGSYLDHCYVASVSRFNAPFLKPHLSVKTEPIDDTTTAIEIGNKINAETPQISLRITRLRNPVLEMID